MADLATYTDASMPALPAVRRWHDELVQANRRGTLPVRAIRDADQLAEYLLSLAQSGEITTGAMLSVTLPTGGTLDLNVAAIRPDPQDGRMTIYLESLEDSALMIEVED